MLHFRLGTLSHQGKCPFRPMPKRHRLPVDRIRLQLLRNLPAGFLERQNEERSLPSLGIVEQKMRSQAERGERTNATLLFDKSIDQRNPNLWARMSLVPMGHIGGTMAIGRERPAGDVMLSQGLTELKTLTLIAQDQRQTGQ